MADFSEEKETLEARLRALEILTVGLYGVLAKHGTIKPEALIDELATAEHLMRQNNAHSEIVALLRDTREHVEDEADKLRGGP